MTLRVVVADDSLSVRKRLVGVLQRAEGIEVVAEAEDGQQAFELCRRLRPDAVTLDMAMPFMTGVEATRAIMAECPTPILLVSSSTNRGELLRLYDALAAGAVDALEKPPGDDSDALWDRKFIDAVKLVARVRVIRRVLPERGSYEPPKERPPLIGQRLRLVAIGASTGGPKAISDILGGLPRDFPLPVICVLHMSSTFSTSIAEWLNTRSSLPVIQASDGERLPNPGAPNRVILAPADHHLVLEGKYLRWDDGPERHSCRPSVDVLFESLAAQCGGAVAACLLTGMGKDGALGMLSLRRAGAVTIAQDEASSVVFGMAQEAVHLRAVSRVLPIDRIAAELTELARQSEARD